MNSKKIITIIVIVAAFAGAGVFAYMSLRDDASSLVTTSDQPAAPILLPYGDKLDFSAVNKFNQTGRIFQQPVTTAADVGLQLNEIISQ